MAHIVSSPYREKVIQAFKRYKTPLHMDIELPTLQAIKRFVAMGNGVALCPPSAWKISVKRPTFQRHLLRCRSWTYGARWRGFRFRRAPGGEITE